MYIKARNQALKPLSDGIYSLEVGDFIKCRYTVNLLQFENEDRNVVSLYGIIW